MRIRSLAVGIVLTASLYGQSRRFSWQNYCFDHPAAVVCPGHEYAVKPQPGAKGAAARTAVNNPFPPASRPLTPSVIVIGGGIDWRFADPFADGIVGLNFSSLSGSPLARDLLVQLGASRGVPEADTRKIFDALSGVGQMAISVRDNHVVGMITGSGMEWAPSVREAGVKIAPVSPTAIVVGHVDAVDQAIQRIAMKSVPSEMTKLADGVLVRGEFWIVGSAALAGPQAVSAGAKRFSAAVSIRNQVTSDVAFEFDRPPDMNTLQEWQKTLGSTTIEGNTIHFVMSMGSDEARRKLGQLAAGPLGPRLMYLLAVAKYLPERDTTVRVQNKPVIYGLDGGPKVVDQVPTR
jgi:hypothetical protein